MSKANCRMHLISEITAVPTTWPRRYLRLLGGGRMLVPEGVAFERLLFSPVGQIGPGDPALIDFGGRNRHGRF